MATQQCPPPAQRPRLDRWQRNCAMAVALAGPVALFLPPRRLGLQALFLSGSSFWATNLLMHDWTGESMTERFSRRFASLSNLGLPEKARRNQELARRELERRQALLPQAERRRLQEESERKEAASRGFLARLWLGGEKENWREERAKREEEVLQGGEGYGTLIMDQIGEVVGLKKDAEAKADSKPTDTDEGNKR